MGAVWWRRRERESGQGMNDLPTTSFDRLYPTVETKWGDLM